jgi:CRP/FNR family transcriptional regulator, anaerobic regulatory protein
VDALFTHYPMLAQIPDIVPTLECNAPLALAAGTMLFTEGQPCQGFPLVVDGGIRVYKQTENGREIPLYRVQSGESCIVTTSCLINGSRYDARGITESLTHIHMLPVATFRSWLAYPAFRDYVLGLFAERMSDLMTLVEEIAFRRLDARLAAKLLGHGRIVHTTHAQLANELGSVREMVSRLLKGFETQGFIRLGREQIEIVNPAGLRAVSS